MRLRVVLLALMVMPAWTRAEPEASTQEFCLTGEFDLGSRLQGLRPEAGEFYPARWCVITESHTDRVHFVASGRSNPDMEDSFALSYLPPGQVRIVNTGSPPDIEFRGAIIGAEALRHRRIDPRRLLEEIENNPEWVVARTAEGKVNVRYPDSDSVTSLHIAADKLLSVSSWADMPLRGRVPVEWRWRWAETSSEPLLELKVDGELMFRAAGQRRELARDEAEKLWQPSAGQPPREVPGKAWPARIAMTVETLAEGVHFIRGVRTGFHHLVIETETGLVVGDAPAGWVEIQQIPPADLVPGLGISGLSERLIDFLRRQWPGQPIRAVALTHAHDDHAGGARAFAAAGAQIYGPASAATFLQQALNRPQMPDDRLSASGRSATVMPVNDRVILADRRRSVELLMVPPGPHVSAALGIWVPTAGVFFQSDLHVPNADTDEPRSDRAATECWFARWAVAHLPDNAVVLTSHGTQRSTIKRLARYTESEICAEHALPS